MAASGVAGVAVLLGVVGVGQHLAVNQARAQVKSAEKQVAVQRAYVNGLQVKTTVHQEALARAAMVVASLQGDVNWVSVVQKLGASMPPGVTITSLDATRTEAPPASPGTSGKPTAGVTVGSISLSVTGPGGLRTAAAWLEGLQRDHQLTGTWVQGISVASGSATVTFSSISDLTKYALSNRAEMVKP